MLIDFIERLDSRSKQVVAVVVDVAMLPFALWCTLTLRHGHWQLDWVQFWPAFAVTLACVPLFAHLGLYRHIIRYMGREALLAVFWGITITAIALAAVAYMVQIPDFPRSVPAIFWLLSFFYVTITRFAVRSYAESVVRRDVAKKPVAIYGAGPAGAYLAYQLQRGRDYRPVAFLDQNKSLHGNVIQGLKVYPVVGLPQLVSKHVVEQVLIALPGASPEERRRAIETLEPYPVRVRVIPDMDAVVAGAGTVSDIRDVDLSDLLGRDEVVPLPHLLRGSVTNRAVLVTGAGGVDRFRAVPPDPPPAAAPLGGVGSNRVHVVQGGERAAPHARAREPGYAGHCGARLSARPRPHGTHHAWLRSGNRVPRRGL